MSAGASRVWTEFIFMKRWPEPGKPVVRAGCCGLCGNTGIIDTRDSARTVTGDPAGVLAFCICPNGRKRKRQRGLRTWNSLPETGGSVIEAPEAVNG